MSDGTKYCEYFNVDEAYFPCIDESAIKGGAKWEATFPHETFIKLLISADKMLGGNTKKSIWIHGSYGTGKSQCAFALQNILKVPAEEVKAYWNLYEPLKNESTLLQSILGHKERGILTAYRYGTGTITSPQLLFNAVQESVSRALDDVPGSYKGQGTLKESVIAWLNDEINKHFFNELLQEPEWKTKFSQSNADEVISDLQANKEISTLMSNIFELASERQITAFSLTADSLCAWLKDVITQNNKKIVLIWDEFSEFFKQNNFLSEFQRIVSLCQETHFYFVIVTHPITTLAKSEIQGNSTLTVVQQRFDLFEITLPSNIAFQLINHAISVKKSPETKARWNKTKDDLNSFIQEAKQAVIKTEQGVTDSIMKDMLPIHPMAALVLKNIAASFQSNQRSMFDFIKTPKDLNVHAFQYFIANTGYDSPHPLLTVDMLWDFFYERGKEYLTPGARSFLDVFPRQSNLNESEKAVLKTILIMLAIDYTLAGTNPFINIYRKKAA